MNEWEQRVDVYRTEEEQLEALKKWWQTNGKAVIMGIGASLLLIVGWRAWQDHSRSTSEAASVAYQEVLEAAQKAAANAFADIMPDAAEADGAEDGAESDSADEADAEDEDSKLSVEQMTLATLGAAFIEDHGKTAYAQIVSLLLAKQAVTIGDLALAEENLRWVLAQDPAKSLRQLTKARLAKVLIAQDKADDARRLLESETTTAYRATYSELLGDISLQQGDMESARRHYQTAVNAATKDGNVSRPLLNLKLNDLATIE